MERSTRTKELFANEGLYCAQAILQVYGEPFGITPEKAMCMGRCLCGAISSRGWEACGYVMGGVLALSHANDGPDEEAARERTKKVVGAFLASVKDRFGSIKCKDLLGADLSTEEGWKKMQEEKLTSTVCPPLGEDVARVLEGFI